MYVYSIYMYVCIYIYNICIYIACRCICMYIYIASWMSFINDKVQKLAATLMQTAQLLVLAGAKFEIHDLSFTTSKIVNDPL